MEHAKSPRSGQKQLYQGPLLEDFFPFSSSSVWSCFGTNRQDAVVFLSSKALKCFSIALQWEYDC